MSNRKTRRTASAKDPIRSANEIPLSQPIRNTPNHKTLYDIAAERQAELLKDQTPQKSVNSNEPKPRIVRTSINPDGTISESEDAIAVENGDEDPIGSFGQAIFFASTLTMLHFTLDVLVHQQYGMSMDWGTIASSTATAFPILVLLVYIFRPRASRPWAQCMFLLGSVLAGCYLVYSSNKEAYYAVMKRAPPLGTLWVWSVMEMRLEVALLSLLAVGWYFWWGSYTIF